MGALQLRRGLKANLPTSAVVGEPLIATDTRELYIGTGTSVYKIGDVIFASIAPDVEKEKIWIDTAANQIYRASDDGVTWVACTADISGLIPKTDIATATDLGNLTPSDIKIPSQKAVKTYVDTVVAGLTIPKEWPDSVISIISADPASPIEGDRYIVGLAATGLFTGKEQQIAEFKGGVWTFTAGVTGSFISVDSDTTGLYYFGGSDWVKKSFELTTVDKGLTVNAGKIGIDPTIAGTGLSWDAANGVLSVGTIDGGTF